MDPIGFSGTVVVLTQDDEPNIRYCLESVIGWAKKVFVVDSFSKDRTAEIARACGAEVVQHEFTGLAEQRNWALDNLPLEGEWVFSLDSDEQATPQLKSEIEQSVAEAKQEVAGFAMKHAFIFLGRHLKHAQDGPFLVRVFRIGHAQWHCEGARDRCHIDGQIRKLRNRIWHEDHKGLSAWIDKHNRFASWEAQLMVNSQETTVNSELTSGQSLGTKRIRARQILYNWIPSVIRPFVYFFYRYVLRLGLLDGREGFAYCFLQAFWYPMLIDFKLMELRKRRSEA